MAVAAIDAVVGHLVHMTELKGLLDEDLLCGDVAGPRKHDRE